MAVDATRLEAGDAVRLAGDRIITDVGPEDDEHIVARPGEVGEVVDVEPWRGWLGEFLGPWGVGFRVRSYTVWVAFPDAPFGPVECLPEELIVC